MESLRPDQDDVSARRGAPTTRRAPPSSSPAPEAPAPRSEGGASIWSSLLPVLMVALLGGWVWWLQDQLSGVTQQLDEAQAYIRQSNLLLARFEGQLSETGEALDASGNAVGDRLKHLDDEVRKLWGVANDRNKKAIAANEAAIAEQVKASAALSKRVDALNAELAQARSGVTEAAEGLRALRGELDTVRNATESARQQLAGLQGELERIGQLDKQLTTLQERQRTQEGQQLLNREELSGRLGVLERRLEGGADKESLAGLRGRIDKMDEILGAVDASRAQVTRRLLTIEQRLQQLEVSTPR